MVSAPGLGEAYRFELPTGRLEVSAEPGQVALRDVCSFAARRNPKRGFLFASRVLGRYFPVLPSVLEDMQLRLAARLPELEGPAVVLGVAEAGIALAQGAHAAWVGASGRSDLLFVHTTRYRFEEPLAFGFEEPHSHAPAHYVYLPRDPAHRSLMEAARTVVVIDDEVTSGRTFAAIAARYKARFPRARRFIHLVLTSWLDTSLSRAVRDAGVTALDVELEALVHGRYRWLSGRDAVRAMPRAVGNGACKSQIIGSDYGRFGRLQPPARGRLPEVGAGERVLVLGSGELIYPAFQLARGLERAGSDVRFACTTRAPVLEGGPIEHVLRGPDNYDDGIDNYLYNVRPDDFDRVFFCTETGPAHLPSRWLEMLDAEPIYF